MHLDVGGYRSQIAGVAVASGDLKGHQGHLPWALRWPQWLIDASHVENEDPACTQLDRTTQRNAVDQAPVEVMSTLNDRRWQQPGYGCRGQHGVHDEAPVEPVLRSVLDVRRAACEADGQVFDALIAQHVGDRPPQGI